MLVVMLLLLTIPVAAAAHSACGPPQLSRRAVTAVSGIACFVLVIAIVPAASQHYLNYLSYLRIDAISVVFMLATGFLYASVAVYSVGYLERSG